MLRSEAISIIKRGLGFRQTQDPAIIAALKQAQRDLESGQTLPNWLLKFDEPVAITPGTGVVALPPRFLRVHEDYPYYYVNSSGAQVHVPRKHNVEAYQAYVASGTPNDTNPHRTSESPSVYVQDTKTRIHLVPIPTVTTTLYLTYYKAAEILDSDIENAWLKNAANYIIGLAGVMVAGDVRDKGAMEKFNLMTKVGRSAALNDIIEDELAGRPLVMGRNN